MNLPISISGDRDRTVQIYKQFRAAIVEGRLQPSDRLPATRELAKELGVARRTVTIAYEMLIGDGLLIGRSGSGTFVSALVPERKSESKVSRSPIVLKPFWKEPPQLFRFPRPEVTYDFGVGVPDVSRFPWPLWRSILRSRSRFLSRHAQSYADPEGYPPLRKAITRYLGISRALVCAPSDIVVTNGAQQAFALIASILVQPGTIVAMENPGYPMARWLFQSYGGRIVDVPVDREGLLVERLPKHADLVYTTPSHQFPLGVTMSLRRKAALLEWAASRGAAVIEDDYDSEFRFDGRPLEALQSTDSHGVVLYVGTFSKVLFPGIRVGFVVSPPPLRQALTAAKQLTDWCSPLLMQATIAQFIEDGHLARHVRRTRRLYKERRDVLIQELEGRLSPWLTIIPSSTGLHVTATLKRGLSSEVVAKAALEAGIRLRSIPNSGLTFGYGAIESARIKKAAEALQRVLRAQ